MDSREAAKHAKEERAEELARIVVDCGFHLHRSLGPGLLESVYEATLCHALSRRGLHVARQHPVAFEYDGMSFDDGLRLDLLVEGTLVVELKSVETLAAVPSKQLLT
jgi:GxxExxY protein